MPTIRIALVGDYQPAVPAHCAIPGALVRAGAAAGCTVAADWIATPALAGDPAARLAGYDGVWCVPASPYASMDGALGAIRVAREGGIPFLGTCGGFQHALIEYARNVLGIAEADHAETRPDAALPLIAPLACSLAGGARGTIRLVSGSRVRAIYGRDEIVEEFNCNFGVNAAFEPLLDDGRLRVTGRDPQGAVRVVELPAHPFYLATLFQPERATLGGAPHPLIDAYVAAVAARAERATREPAQPAAR